MMCSLVRKEHIMSWLKELSFVDTTGAKKNHSFWKVSDPSDFLVGANAAFELLNFYQRYPEMKHSPLLYRITNDMNRSGLLSSESVKGFFSKITPHISFDSANEIDYLPTKPQEQLSVPPEKKERRIASIENISKELRTTTLRLLNFLTLLNWIDDQTLIPSTDALDNRVLRLNKKSQFGFVFTKKGEDLIKRKYRLLND
ncbi:hypothetical protein HMPREF9348_04630 [Escherichia coli MS 145-7]|nr:hypothetical protein HMPREF9348_04630 [Escherichia coli MS 145-7]